MSSLIKIQLRNFIFKRSCSFLSTFNVSHHNAFRNIFVKGYNCNVAANNPESLNKNYDVLKVYNVFKYLRLIKGAVREFGPVVEENKKLLSIIAAAKKHDIPLDFIEFATKIPLDARTYTGFFEVFLSSGCHFIVRYEDYDVSVTRHHLLSLSDSFDATVLQGSSKWQQHFDQKGILSVQDGENKVFKNKDDAAKVALQIGAECVGKEHLQEDSCWMFHCDPMDLHRVKKSLCEKGFPLEEAFVGYIPKKELNLSDNARNNASNLLLEMNKVPTIDTVFGNVSWQI